MNFLLIDHDKKLANTIAKNLKLETLNIDVVRNAHEGFSMAMKHPYHLIFLDLEISETNSFELLRNLRNNGTKIPILALSKKDTLEGRVQALLNGADDFLLKPLNPAEFSARVQALLRRDQWRVSETTLEIADLKIDLIKREVKRNQRLIDLTSKELGLLEYLVRHRGQAITRNMIAEQVWDQHFDAFTNVIDVYVRYLRKKVDEGFYPQLIHTIRGVGYTVDIKQGVPEKPLKRKTSPKKTATKSTNTKKSTPSRKKKKTKSVSKKT